MMRIAALYDIHGNLPSLEAVLEEVRANGVDRIVVGGDVFPGPMPVETYSCLLSLDIETQFIQGDGDREVFAQMAGVDTDWYRNAPEPWREPVRWTAQQLASANPELSTGWPATCQLCVPEIGDVLFCHATPQSDKRIFTRETPEDPLLPFFAQVEAALVVCGHTHMQFDRMIGKVRVVNAGSVGMPYGEPGAYWLLLGPDVQLRYTMYDLQAAAERIRRTAYAQADQFAEHSILQPPSEVEMLGKFAQAKNA